MKTFASIHEYLTAIGIERFQRHEHFFIFKIEDYFGTEEVVMPPHTHDFFELTFGRGHDVNVNIGSVSFNATASLISFTMPHQVTSWKVNSFQEDSLGYMVLFQPEFIHSFYTTQDIYQRFSFFNFFFSPLLALTDVQDSIITNLMQILLDEFSGKSEQGERQDIILGAYLTILLEKLNAMFTGTASQKVFISRAEEITFLFEGILRKEANYQSRLGDYATQLNISKAYLSEVIKKTTGKSAKALLQEMIIHKAKTLLQQSSATVATIAYELGFTDSSNFVKYFKHQVGITPNTYRQQP